MRSAPKMNQNKNKTTQMKKTIEYTLLVSLCAAVLAGCKTTQTPYVQLSKIVKQHGPQAVTERMQPPPQRFSALNIGDIVIRNPYQTSINGRRYVADTMRVAASPIERVRRYHHPDISDAGAFLSRKMNNDLGNPSTERYSAVISAEDLHSIALAYGEPGKFNTEIAWMRQNNTSLVLTIISHRLDSVNQELRMRTDQLANDKYNVLKTSRFGMSEDNFTNIRLAISELLEAAIPLKEESESGAYIIADLLWSDEIIAHWVNNKTSQTEASAGIDMAAFVSGLTGTPKAQWKSARVGGEEAVLAQTRVFWGYNAYQIHRSEDRSVHIDFKSPLVLDTRLRRVGRGG